ncbi:Phosphatidylinositide phosphatase SAC1 [Quaeritorhiza haematococci]|nr:Phosphatidylinositide phosphatase SAC1 [Quaeritorhiza haematococci]
MAVHDSLHLYISNDSLTFEPLYLDPAVSRETLSISRENGAISLNGPASNTLRQEEVIMVYGILGMIRLNAGEHVIVITNRTRVGRIFGHDVFKVAGHKIIPVPRSRLHLSDKQLRDDETYIALLEDMLKLDYLFFSYGYDLTNTLQRQTQSSATNSGKKLWEKADDRFFWNRYIQSRFIDITAAKEFDLGNFILPIICGFVEIRPTAFNGKPFTFNLISRRSRYRAGTRFNVRGVDAEGNAANYVETEQIVSVDDTNHKASFVQTRGSIPLYWQQIVNVKYTPKLHIEPHTTQGEVFRKHFMDQIRRYGNQIAVNLINKKGYELRLGDEFAKHISIMSDPRITYVHFDFHHECRKMRWDRISKLVEQIEGELNQQGYCHIDENGRLLRVQSSVVRTNCMDCLDRTNVVQSVLARRCLTQQLKDLNILGPQQRVEETGELELLFKHVWADNADAVSTQYSGTGALKTDFTRTGKRTRQGALQDGINSVVRYIKNNYLDGWRQDSFDLFLGVYEVNPHSESPFTAQQRNVTFYALPLGAIFSIFMILYLTLAGANSWSMYFFYLLFWMAVLMVSLRLIMQKGTEFVDKPRLAKRRIAVNGAPAYEYEAFAKARQSPASAFATPYAFGSSTATSFNTKEAIPLTQINKSD